MGLRVDRALKYYKNAKTLLSKEKEE